MTTFTSEILQALRRDTPGAANRVHFNNAGAGLMPRPVLDAMRDHLELEASIGGYEAAAAMRQEIKAFYDSVATLLHTRPGQVAFAASATDAYNKALSTINFKEGDVILTTKDDYISNQIAFLQISRRFRTHVVWADTAPEGGVDLQHMAELMDRHRPVLVAVTHVPTNSGLVQPVAQIGEQCRDRGLLYLVDACQSVGQLDVDVSRLHCDFLSATFRKFLRGPRGAGFLYVSERVLEKPMAPLFLDLHSARWTSPETYEPAPNARRFELWEKPYAAVLGARAATDYATNIGLPAIEKRITAMAETLRNKLDAIEGIRVTDLGRKKCAIVSLTAEGWQPKAFRHALEKRGFNTSLHTRQAAHFDFEAKALEWTLRASLHYYNTEAELGQFADAVTEIMDTGS